MTFLMMILRIWRISDAAGILPVRVYEKTR